MAIKAKTTKTKYSSPLNKKQTTMYKMYNKNNTSKTAAQLKTAENTQLDINQYFHFASAFSPPSPTSELRNRQLCGVVVNCLQIMIMDTSQLHGSWSASARSYRILMWTGPTGANLHDRCHDLSESSSA